MVKVSGHAWQGIGGFLSFVALGLLIPAQTNHNWVVFSSLTLSSTSNRTEYGIYEKCLTSSAGFTSCIFYGWQPTAGDEITAYTTRILLIIVDIIVGIAFLAGFLAWCLTGRTRERCLLGTGIVNMIGGGLMIVTAIVYVALALSLFLINDLTGLLNVVEFKTFYFQYCYAFCWVAGILYIAAGVFQIIASKSDDSKIGPTKDPYISDTRYSYPPQRSYRNTIPGQRRY